MQELGECVGGTVRDGGWHDGRWAEEPFSTEAREDFCGGGEEDSEAKREVVGAVAGVGEELAGDLEVSMSN